MPRSKFEAQSPILGTLQAQVAHAHATGTPLRIVGGDTKRGWWQTTATTPLSLNAYAGIVAYEPSELVITACAGTPLKELEAALAARGQMLGFEPPRTGPESTIGGVIAAALSGPARPYCGAARDFVLGVSMLTNEGEIVRFGGQVMKNVAGYDLSRLATGSWGRLGPLTEISLRVSPRPEQTLTAQWRCDEQAAWRHMRDFGRASYPISGCRYEGGMLHLRLSGTAPAIAYALDKLAPEETSEATDDWLIWRDFTHPFFDPATTMWRAVVPSATRPLPVQAVCGWDWGGALRWYKHVSDSAQLERAVVAAGGHVRRWPATGLESAPDAAARALATRVRASFDPTGMFNPA